MSIVRGSAMLSRSFRTLIFQTDPVVLTLRSYRPSCAADAFSIDMQVLTDLKRFFPGALSKNRTRARLLPSCP